MIQFKSAYLGQLRNKVTHLKSETELITDAPTDNHGKGESFSPTDLVAVALGTCMVTIMGIYSNKNGINMPLVNYETEKVMKSNPRAISKIRIHFKFEENNLTTDEQEQLKNAALSCPVALSINPDIQQEISFEF
ncbi:OsmC family protein [Flexithrix dorotheae]|uniref:OsmC family protein n=1 Tax=Flexithrix dorotheae TaxID=70993 RepID=UPI00037E8704|nr:OsmC family protein [Flexithrix dorotheae]